MIELGTYANEPIDVDWKYVEEEKKSKKKRKNGRRSTSRFSGVLGGLVRGIFNIFKKILPKRQIWSLINGLVVWLICSRTVSFIFTQTSAYMILEIVPIKVATIKTVLFFVLIISALFVSAKNRQGITVIILILSVIPLVIVGKIGGIALFLLGCIFISVFAETSTGIAEDKKNKKN